MSVTRSLALTASLALVGSSFGLPARGQETWPTYQANAQHSGFVPVALDTSKFAPRWQRPVGDGSPLNPIAVGDGRLFVTTLGYFSNAGLFVHDADTGNELWRVTYGDVFSVNPPAYHAGKVFLQTGNHASDTYLRAYFADSGALAFQAAHAAQWESYLAPTIVDGTVYVDGGYYGGMYAFDENNGARRWFAGFLPQYDQWTPAVDASYAYAYLGEYSPALYAVNRADGTLAFRIDDPNFDWNGWSMDGAPVLGGANDVFAIHNGRLIRFDLTGRRIAWELPRTFTGQPSVAHGVVYAIDSGALTAWSQTTGAFLWSFGLPTEKLVGPIVVTETHALVPGERATYAVDLLSHTSDWSYPLTGALALAGGSLYIASYSGVLAAIDAGPAPDRDADGVADRVDNCPDVPNADQADRDGDGVGDACNDAADRDGDEFADPLDNCPDVANPAQSNADGDAFGDACDPFPQDANNEFAQCRVERDACQADLSSCLAAGGGDSDHDGVADPGDACPHSPAGLAIDWAGCTRAEFCARSAIDGMLGAARCLLADWQGPAQGVLDCRVAYTKGKLLCVAR